MEIEDSPVYQEIKQIIDSGEKQAFTYWRASVHVFDDAYPVLKFVDFYIERDYINNYADNLLIKLLIPFGLWGKIIYPNRTNLEISITKEYLNEDPFGSGSTNPPETLRLRAVPNVNNIPVITATDYDKMDMRSLDNMNIYEIEFQLFDKSIDKLRLVSVGGIFRNTRNEDVLKSVYAAESKKLKIDTGDILDGVDIVPSDNKERRDHVIIPHGTLLTDLHTYMQEKTGGVYNSGIGRYFQNRVWYIYPLFNTTRLQKVSKSLTLVKVPKVRYTGIERTYRQTGDQLYVIGTSDASFDDDAMTRFSNQGNGIRFTDSRQVMQGGIKTEDNKVTISRKQFNTEYVFKDREGLNFVDFGESKITANPFAEYTRLAANLGSTFHFVWEHSNPSLLIPGMMVRILYLNKDRVEELNGVLVNAQTWIRMAQVGITAKRHSTSTSLFVFANKPPNQEETQEPSDVIKIKKEWMEIQGL